MSMCSTADRMLPIQNRSETVKQRIQLAGSITENPISREYSYLKNSFLISKNIERDKTNENGKVNTL
jgi:hypothetical protein